MKRGASVTDVSSQTCSIETLCSLVLQIPSRTLCTAFNLTLASDTAVDNALTLQQKRIVYHNPSHFHFAARYFYVSNHVLHSRYRVHELHGGCVRNVAWAFESRFVVLYDNCCIGAFCWILAELRLPCAPPFCASCLRGQLDVRERGRTVSHQSHLF